MSKWKKKKHNPQAETVAADEMKRELLAQMTGEKYGEALGTIAAMIEKGIEDADAFYDAAYIYFVSGDYERAADWLDHTLRLSPQHIGARILLARICLLEERTSDGFAIFEFVLKNYEAALSAEEREEMEETLDCCSTTKADEILAEYPAIARFLQMEGADEAQERVEEKFRPLASQVQRVEAKAVQQTAAEPVDVSDDEASARRLSQEILAKDTDLLEKMRLLNSFAGGFFLAGSFRAAKYLLKQALTLDAHDDMTLRNMSYTLAALGEHDAALTLVASMKMPDFGLLTAIRG